MQTTFRSIFDCSGGTIGNENGSSFLQTINLIIDLKQESNNRKRCTIYYYNMSL
jgi:hypothetical protein